MNLKKLHIISRIKEQLNSIRIVTYIHYLKKSRIFTMRKGYITLKYIQTLNFYLSATKVIPLNLKYVSLYQYLSGDLKKKREWIIERPSHIWYSKLPLFIYCWYSDENITFELNNKSINYKKNNTQNFFICDIVQFKSYFQNEIDTIKVNGNDFITIL